eukprot:gnl/MRDRNA2_/MRDRNA2_85172_c0_seq1.p1 gnl/MRDRNA2_/MRDRNA2_85172_c0~~gnl/MRDRNA2_/MRDRNA2_85172_c0_seq1.p1  ORF type:complete len:280 (-),score=57.35 gnl/MRDRNA2_/MRDRNA2_85172_c0_seq1:342-1181(-)
MQSFAILLVTFAAMANAKESTDTLMDRLVDRSFAKGETELDNTVLGKGTMRMAASSAAKVPILTKPLGNTRSANTFSPQLPQIRGAAFIPSALKNRGAIISRGHWADKEVSFNYKDIKFQYETIKPSEVMDMLKQGWTLLDVRQPEQVERAEIHGAVEVPLFVLKDDFSSPIGIYQEMVAFGLGGWWMGGRPMKENKNFVRAVEHRIGKNAKILAVCQSGLRSKQALKELHLAGFKNLALVKGGLNAVRNNEIPCEEEGCRLDLAGSGSLAGMLGWHAN